MGQLLLILAGALVVGLIVFGVAVLITGNDPGLEPAEPDGLAQPLPADRPLVEHDLDRVRFDSAVRGYRMVQVDHALRRAAYDIGYKDELVSVLSAEVEALRTGRTEDAEVLRRARQAAITGAAQAAAAAAEEEPKSRDGTDQPADRADEPDDRADEPAADGGREGASVSIGRMPTVTDSPESR